ncbi:MULTISPECIES: 8-amino-7-oxononanoate synthase [unclassified Rhizobium]|uniref:8-amino-7-oxononanoate synthase n=1 Tax=unclassified Rhizobium TaxID=2613769 RepID=UPI0016193895|nr:MULTISPECIES: 8-amino-7-oxononanoate synthase [unclassified Rhizobium]MBB3318742.1 8-amino-7-oxononanoate synthase [Rhizobium sp. BK181]MBB3543075.1 8-amino-7-oxononanoate synthase [Rhizobium sp. BK399]MCS3742291.1 8-amino-7-oxononanoate synthase [Rhizobium sp. BK661]MCS4094881.1 8-amino-7-oxononanoate synthase [Rhizobium sp. BK176]
MSGVALARYAKTMAGLERKSRIRSVTVASGIDFASNDYLGFANSARLKAAIRAAVDRGVPVGAGASRLLRGNHIEHEMLEAEAARLFGVEKSLYFASGYAANAAIFSTLPLRDDLVVYDELIHASAMEGISASKAITRAVPHNDACAVEQAIREWRDKGGKGVPWIGVESLYSMDGDRAPLRELAELARRHDGFLVVDEAHATGVFGQEGRGLAANLGAGSHVLTVHTCGKALGASGALLGGPKILVDYLINRARNFIYSTAPSPLMAAAVREALRFLADEPERLTRLEKLVAFASAQLQSRLAKTPSGSQIIPVLIGDNGRAVSIARQMQAEGFDIRAIRPPTVPEGTARLRISITLNVEEQQISAMFERLFTILKENGQ